MDTPAPPPNFAPFSPQPPAAQKSKWRWVRRIGLTTSLVVVGLIAAAPTLITKYPDLRDYLVRRFMGKLNGDIVIKEFSVGWFSPLKIEGLQLLPHADSQPVPGSSSNRDPLVAAARIETERELWRMLWDRSDIGTIRIERPEVFLALGEKGASNFADVFRPILDDEAKTPTSLKFGARAQIVDGTLRGLSAETREPWQITGINLAVGVRAAEHAISGKPELYVEKGNLVSKQELTVGMCNDVLKYVAPVMAKVARARGTISIDLKDWRLPWKDFASGELAGSITMNSVDLGPGALTQSYLNRAGALPLVGQSIRSVPVPQFVNIARESVIEFKMIEGGRIEHSGLRFDLAGLFEVDSHGTVGLDETLDLHTGMQFHPPNKEARKLAIVRALDDQRFTIDVRGKLGAPEIDASAIGGQVKNLLLYKTTADWISGRPSVGGNLLGEIAEKLVESGALPPEVTANILSQIPPPPGTPPAGPALLGPPGTGPQPLGPTPRVLEPGTTIGPALAPANGGVNPNAVHPNTSNAAVAPPIPNSTPPDLTAPAPAGTAPAFGPVDGIKLGLDVFSAIRAHRQQQQRPQPLPPGSAPQDPNGPAPVGTPTGTPPANPPVAAPNGPLGFGILGPAPTGTSGSPPPRRPLLRQGIRALLDVATQPPAPTPTGTGLPPAAQPPVGQPPAPQPPAPANRAP